jgi:hypothetical protein
MNTDEAVALGIGAVVLLLPALLAATVFGIGWLVYATVTGDPVGNLRAVLAFIGTYVLVLTMFDIATDDPLWGWRY